MCEQVAITMRKRRWRRVAAAVLWVCVLTSCGNMNEGTGNAGGMQQDAPQASPAAQPQQQASPTPATYKDK